MKNKNLFPEIKLELSTYLLPIQQHSIDDLCLSRFENNADLIEAGLSSL